MPLAPFEIIMNLKRESGGKKEKSEQGDTTAVFFFPQRQGQQRHSDETQISIFYQKEEYEVGRCGWVYF